MLGAGLFALGCLHQAGEGVKAAPLVAHSATCPAELRAVNGVPFHTPPWALMKERSPLELEMVPEPGNPWDRSAVALDFDGQRIGYLPAEMALAWQPFLLRPDWRVISAAL